MIRNREQNKAKSETDDLEYSTNVTQKIYESINMPAVDRLLVIQYIDTSVEHALITSSCDKQPLVDGFL